MKILRGWSVGILAIGVLVAMAPAAQAAGPHHIEGDYGYYFPGDIELGPNGNDIGVTLDEESTVGVRYGYHPEGSVWGFGLSWTHLNLDNARPDNAAVHCEKCEFNSDFADFSGEWYPGGGEFGLYAGIGWVTNEFTVRLSGSSNNRQVSDDTFSYHVGLAYTWMIGESFYIRPDARMRWFEIDGDREGKYDSEDPELKLGFGWRF